MASCKHYGETDSGGNRKRMKLELACSYHIVWLDSHIYQEKEYSQLQLNFKIKLVQIAAVPPAPNDPQIDGMIRVVREHGTPITFVGNEDQALDIIRQRSRLSKVIFITSGALGKVVIPQIYEEELQVYRYYIFCGAMVDHVEWIMKYANKGIDIVTLDFELDLLIRLARDMCREFIDEGKKLLNTGNAWMALKYFEYALELGNKAYDLDVSKDSSHHHIPSVEHRRVLLGDNGLIAQAKRVLPN